MIAARNKHPVASHQSTNNPAPSPAPQTPRSWPGGWPDKYSTRQSAPHLFRRQPTPKHVRECAAPILRAGPLQVFWNRPTQRCAAADSKSPPQRLQVQRESLAPLHQFQRYVAIHAAAQSVRTATNKAVPSAADSTTATVAPASPPASFDHNPPPRAAPMRGPTPPYSCALFNVGPPKNKKGRNPLGPSQSLLFSRDYASAFATSATSTLSTLLILAALPFRPRK